ncbi:MAG TPA: DUF1552 domain-containing protein [Polyangia bacterium]
MRGARAATPPAAKINACFIGQMDGHIYDMFYPPVGPITTASMKAVDTATTPIALGELAAYAADIGIVKNMDFTFDTHPGCGHPRGGNISITGSAPTGQNPGTTPTHESADWTIAQLAGKEPLNLYAGTKGGGDDCFAFGVGGKVRVANNKPYDVYLTMMGLMPMQGADPAVLARMQARDKSINDVLRSQIQDLMNRKDLSMNDKQRLQTHFASIREIEIGMNQPMSSMGPDIKALGDMALTLKTTPDANDLREAAVKTQLSLIALAFASGMTTGATLQIGPLQDDVQYIINGKRTSMGYHSITHAENGDTPAASPGSKTDGRDLSMVALHHQVDRIHARFLGYMIDQMKLYQTIDGKTLLDSSVVVWTNQMGNGYAHTSPRVPFVYAGSAGGTLKTGVSVDAIGQKNSQLLNSVLTACGVRKADGSPKDDFGDASAAKGIYAGIMA